MSFPFLSPPYIGSDSLIFMMNSHLARAFTISAQLDFIVGFLRAKPEVRAKPGVCAKPVVRAKRAVQFFQLFFKVVSSSFCINFSSKALEIFFFRILLIKNCKDV